MSLGSVLEAISLAQKCSRIDSARRAIVSFSRSEITTAQLVRALDRAGWTAPQIEKLVSSAKRSLKLKEKTQ